MALTQRGYLVIGMWLAGLMLLGVLLSEVSGGWLPLPRWGIATLVLGLSTIKAALVAMYYMHLQSDQRLLALVALVPFVILVLAIGLVYSSRLVQL